MSAPTSNGSKPASPAGWSPTILAAGDAPDGSQPGHVTSAGRLRSAFQQPRPNTIDDGGILRDLADYDAFFGITLD